MSSSEPLAGFATMIRIAERLARSREDTELTPTHLLLAVMSRFDTPWPRWIVERGGLSYSLALRRLGRRSTAELDAAARSEMDRYRASMRLMVVVNVVWVGSAFRGFLSVRRTAPRGLPTNSRTSEIIALARKLSESDELRSDFPSTSTEVGYLLLALATTPGRHLRLLDNSTIVSSLVRRELKLAGPRHRLILACDRPNLTIRRIRMRIDREVATAGHGSLWDIAHVAFAMSGFLLAAALFPITVLANVLMYISLWPAAILVTGMRALCSSLAGCHMSSHRWHEIPGGEVALIPTERHLDSRRVAVAILGPRIIAFAFCVAALTIVLWRTQGVGVVLSPPLFRRPDLLSGLATESIWVAPASFLEGMLSQNGVMGGIGLLAGLAAGLMSMPTYRELEALRLHTGHEAGRGSRLARALTLPASILTGAMACIEAVLPLRSGPLYLTVYILPLFFCLTLAATILPLMPY